MTTIKSKRERPDLSSLSPHNRVSFHSLYVPCKLSLNYRLLISYVVPIHFFPRLVIRLLSITLALYRVVLMVKDEAELHLLQA